MGRLVLRSSAVSGGSSFTFDSGWSAGSGSFANGQTFTFNRGAADLGTGPTIAVYGNFRGGTVGAAVPTTQQIGAFSQMTVGDTGGGADQPTYVIGPDGDTWMNMLTVANTAVGDGTNRQANLSGLGDFDQFYCSFQTYVDGPAAGANFADLNEKTVWITRDGDTGTAGHDVYFQAATNVGMNSAGTPAVGSSADYGWFWDGSSKVDNLGLSAHDSGHNVSGVQTFRSIGVKPHTTAAIGAFVDGFIQQVCSLERYQQTTTGLARAWPSSGVTAAWNQVYFIGYYQHRGADLPKATYYLVKDFYFATGPNSHKRFFITDASTISASRQMFDCPHSSWAAGQVSLFIPYGISLTGKYLWFGDGTTYTRVGQG